MTGTQKTYGRIFAVALALTALFAAPAAYAQESLRSPVLKKFEEAGGSVDFIGTAHGLDGWVVKDEKGDVKTTVYTTPDGALVSGMLFNPDGNSETVSQLEAYQQRLTGSQASVPGSKDSNSKSEKLYAETETANWVPVGKVGAPYIYIFLNVTCDHCQNFWKDIEDHVKQGHLQARFIPYGKTPDNRDGGAALLSAENPEEAWRAFVGGDKSSLNKDKAKPEAYAKIDANTEMVNKWALKGPPFTLYRRPGDGKLMAIAGRPENTMLLLSEFLK